MTSERQVVARSVFQTEYLAGASPVGVANLRGNMGSNPIRRLGGSGRLVARTPLVVLCP